MLIQCLAYADFIAQSYALSQQQTTLNNMIRNASPQPILDGGGLILPGSPGFGDPTFSSNASNSLVDVIRSLGHQWTIISRIERLVYQAGLATFHTISPITNTAYGYRITNMTLASTDVTIYTNSPYTWAANQFPPVLGYTSDVYLMQSLAPPTNGRFHLVLNPIDLQYVYTFNYPYLSLAINGQIAFTVNVIGQPGFINPDAPLSYLNVYDFGANDDNYGAASRAGPGRCVFFAVYTGGLNPKNTGPNGLAAASMPGFRPPLPPFPPTPTILSPPVATPLPCVPCCQIGGTICHC